MIESRSHRADDADVEAPTSLREVLLERTDAEVQGLASAQGIALDLDKRISIREQLARALATRGKIRRADGFSPEEQALLVEALYRAGRWRVRALPPGSATLLDEAWLFQRPSNDGLIDLVLPAVYMLQVPYVEGEDHRSVRNLLRTGDRSELSQVARHFDPRAPAGVSALALEAAYIALSQPQQIRRVLSELGPAEAQLMTSVVERGGEVDDRELLELQQAPLRIALANSLSTSRRGLAFELTRRGLLLSLPPNRHLVPHEVMCVVSARQRRLVSISRAKARRDLSKHPVEPLRAQFSFDPGPLALAMALLVRQRKRVREGVGTPKTLLRQLAAVLGANSETVALLAALSRKLGLWSGPIVSFGDVRLGELGQALFEAWRLGLSWDEGRLEPELARAPSAQREQSPAGASRHVVLAVLVELATTTWAPLSVIVASCLQELELSGFSHQLARFARRTGVAVVREHEWAKRMLLHSLWSLGVVDVGHGDEQRELSDPLVRVSARARHWLNPPRAATRRSSEPKAAGEPAGPGDLSTSKSDFVEGLALRLHQDAPVGAVLELTPLIDVGEVTEESMDLVVSEARLLAAADAAYDRHHVEQLLEAVAPLSGEVERLLQRVFASRGHGEFVAAQGFLWVDDPELLSELRANGSLKSLFLEPSPSGGLLVKQGVTLERLSRRLRRLGIALRVGTEDGLSARRVSPGVEEKPPKGWH